MDLERDPLSHEYNWGGNLIKNVVAPV
jgi:hypothetical protein